MARCKKSEYEYYKNIIKDLEIKIISLELKKPNK